MPLNKMYTRVVGITLFVFLFLFVCVPELQAEQKKTSISSFEPTITQSMWDWLTTLGKSPKEKRIIKRRHMRERITKLIEKKRREREVRQARENKRRMQEAVDIRKRRREQKINALKHRK